MRYIQNYDSLARSAERRAALDIAEAGYASIDTEKVVARSIRLDGEILHINGNQFDLAKYKSIKMIGFGKASAVAAAAFEEVLGARIQEGLIISNTETSCRYVDSVLGTHPRPSFANFEASKRIVEIAESATEDDLVIVIVSGGGSALLCWPESEYRQGEKLYDSFLKVGGTIDELNIVRKNISGLKGGGLAKILYPATVVGVLFSDVPGDDCSIIASGPLCKVSSSIEDAKKIIDKYQLGDFELQENPQEDKYFEKITKIFLINNQAGLEGMKKKAEELGLNVALISEPLYLFPNKVVELLQTHTQEHAIALAGGETKVVVSGTEGKGGRNQLLSLVAAQTLKPGQVFLSLASDGTDNSDSAAAIADSETMARALVAGLNAQESIDRCDAYTFFETLDDLLFTGPTKSNVSDLIFLITFKNDQ